ncbi:MULTISPECIES: hypothetical protein [unclassified Mameliella]|uniref:hypothetical protein n=1 Tax=unclassified Mameliella TaxID=2630630 RepID=UPI00273EBB53|nr:MULTISPECIES: hypothetical protein [unclassified Mameliella]
MTTYQQNYQPGPVFHDAFLAGIKAKGLKSQDFAKKNKLHLSVLRHCSTGFLNGPKGQLVRDKMIKEIGVELFDTLYKARLAAEDAA